MIIVLFCLAGVSTAYAGGAMMQRQRAQKQMLIQRRIQQEQMRRAAERARQVAVQRARQAQIEQVKETLIKKELIERQMAVAQYQAASQAVAAQQEAVKQAAVMQHQIKQQATRAQQKAVQQILLDRALKRESSQSVVQASAQAGFQAGMYYGQQMAAADAEAQEVVTLDQMVGALEESSHPWPLMIDIQAKQAVVEHFIQKFRRQGVEINRPAIYYAHMIDSMAKDAPQMLDNSFDRVLQVVAIIEYDFDNGQDKDAMALQILGEEGFRSNRQRLGLP